jgi:hypothetical protein
MAQQLLKFSKYVLCSENVFGITIHAHALFFIFQRFLLRIPGGIFGLEIEEELLDSYFIEDPNEQLDTIHR